MYRWDKLSVYTSVLGRPFAATKMLARHRRTVAHLAKKRKWRNLYNYIMTTYFVRGEDCGKGVLDPVWKFLPGLTPFLWDIEMEVTTRCYIRCTHCEHTYFPQEYAKQDTPLERVKNVIDELPRLKWINLTGEGSPFLNREFMDMVRYVKGKGIYLDFSHDFHRIGEDTMRELIELDVERIYFSVDGATADTYNKIRVGADFNTSIANLKRFIELKREMNSPLPEICFRMAFFRDNWHEVRELPNFIASLSDGHGVQALGDEPSINVVGLLEFEQTKDWAVELPLSEIESTNRRAARHGLTVYWSHPTHDEGTKPPLDYCVFWTEPYIMVTGHVVPCCAVLMSNKRPLLEKYSFGNVSDAPLKRIWDSPMYRDFRRLVVNPRGKVPVQCVGCRTFNTRDRLLKYGRETFGL